MEDRLSNNALLERFNHIIDWANPLSAVSINTGTKREDLCAVRSTAMRTVEPLMRNELTQFMVAPILEHFFTIMRPAIVIPADELMAGKDDKLRECAEFAADLASHPVHTQWATHAETFRKIAETAGYAFERSDYKDLAVIAPIVADALTTFDRPTCCCKALKVREGKRSHSNPTLLNEVHIFSDIADAVHMYEQIAAPAFIGFFGVEKTYGQNDNAFDNWRYGRSARKSNLMRAGMSEEEYNQTIDDYSRKLYCIVRDGDNCWVFHIPIQMSSNECISNNGSFINWYGHRATYAPIQIFWKRYGTAETTETAIIPYKPRRWSLVDILDEDQKVWLPIFFNTVKDYFFGNAEPVADKALIISETNVILQLPDASDKNAHLPAIVQTRVRIPSAEDLFTRDVMIDEEGRTGLFIHEHEKLVYHGALPLMKWMGISSADIADTPIGFDDIQTEKRAIQQIEGRAVAAYCKVIRDRLPAFWAPRAEEAHKWFHRWLDAHRSEVIDGIRSGRIPADIHVHKQPILDENGQPKMSKKYAWSEETPVYDETDINIGKVQRGGCEHLHAYQWFSSPTLVDKRAPVTVSLYLDTPEAVANVVGMPVGDLPMAIQLMRYAEAFCDNKARICMTVHLLYNKSDFKRTFPDVKTQKGN